MAKVKKMAFGGMGKTVMPGGPSMKTPVGSGFNSRVLPRGGMEQKPVLGGGPSMIRPPTIAGNPRDNNMEKMPSSGGMERKPVRGFNPLPQVGMKKGGKVSSASKRADGIAQRGKTRA